MASKRMFDKAIIDTDRFMDMGMPAKALYFLLGMEADDEGFVSFKKVMRIHGGNDDDIKTLASKHFIIPFESGVVVITDWKNNNWLDSRRIRPTEYQKEKAMLLTEQNKYVLSKGLASIEESSRVESIIEEIADVPSAPWNLEDKLQEMEKQENSYLDVIATFIREKPVVVTNSAQLSNVISRYCRVAKKLAGAYTNKEIFTAVEAIKKDNLKRKYKGDEVDYTLETILKYLTK